MAVSPDGIAKNVTNFNADDNASASTEIIEIENAETAPALTLPPEILRHICGYLSRKDTLNLRLSHSRFRDHVNTIPSIFESPLVVANGLKTIFLYNGSIFTCGQNRFGELGHGDTTDKLSPTHIDRAVFQGKKVARVVAGALHTIFLCDDGSVFTCGYNNFGQLGHGDTTEKLSPTLIDSAVFQGKKVVRAAVGMYHTIFLCDDGSVFACGRNYYGQLGHGDTTEKLSPMLIDSAVFDYKRVVQVVASGFNSFFFCENGRVFSCGENGNGQLGLNDTTNRLLPTEVLALYNPYFEAMRLRKVLLDKIVALNQNKEGFKEKVGKAVAMVLDNTRFSPAIPGALLKALNMLNGEPCYDKNSKTKYESQLKADIEELTASKDAQAPFAPLFQKTLREIEWLEELAERDTDGQSLKTSTRGSRF